MRICYPIFQKRVLVIKLTTFEELQPVALWKKSYF